MLSRGEDLALLMGRLFVAALFLPSGFHKLMTFSAYAASLKAKGLPLPMLWGRGAGRRGSARSHRSDHWCLPALDGAGACCFHGCHALANHRTSFAGAVFRPRQNADLYRPLAIMGGLLFYFASGPGAWSWKGNSAGRAAKA